MILAVNFSDIFKDSFLSNFSNTISLSTIIFTLVYAFLISLFVYFISKSHIISNHSDKLTIGGLSAVILYCITKVRI